MSEQHDQVTEIPWWFLHHQDCQAIWDAYCADTAENRTNQGLSLFEAGWKAQRRRERRAQRRRERRLSEAGWKAKPEGEGLTDSTMWIDLKRRLDKQVAAR